MAHTVTDNKTKDPGNSGVSAQFPININELLWEDKDRTLSELLSTHRLPLAVKLKTGDISKYCVDSVSFSNNINSGILSESASFVSSLSTNSGTVATSSESTSINLSSSSESKDTASKPDLTAPTEVILQIHETRRRKIILARKMMWEKRQNDYIVSGEQVEIPVSMKGWFEVVPDDGRPVEYFDTIGGIASSNPKRFLVRTSIVGYQLTTEENGNSCWMPYEIKSGEILTTGIIYADSKKRKHTAHRNILKRLLKPNKSKKEQDLKYLQCYDSRGWEIMIPFIMSGVFSPVGDSSVGNYDAVYELQDLIIAFGLPINTQLIHAVDNKDGCHCPRGVVRLYGTREEELAIVSKVGSDGVLFHENSDSQKFEIPVDTMLFQRGIVRKKPIIKSKLIDGVSYPYNKLTNKSKPGDCEMKDKIYQTTKSMEDFRIRAVHDQLQSTSLDDKYNYVSANFINKSAPEFDDEIESSHSVNQQTKNTQSISARNKHTSLTNQSSKSFEFSQDLEQTNKTEIELPKRIPKGLKKSRSTSILDKLSVRKVKKERAKLKELRGEDVFSKRISRSELSYQDFFNGLDNDDEVPEKLSQTDSGQGSSGGTYQSSSSNSSGACSTSTPNIVSKTSYKANVDVSKSTQRRPSIQKRDLPPIPKETKQDVETLLPNHNASNESLYEHLPPAPQPPHFRRASDSALLDDKFDDDVVNNEDTDDGYMVPQQAQEQRYLKRSDIQTLTKPRVIANDSFRSARARKARSELPRELTSKEYLYDYTRSLDTDDLFNASYTSRKFGENHPLGSLAHLSTASTSQIYRTNTISPRKTKLSTSAGNFNQRFRYNADSEIRNQRNSYKHSGNPNIPSRSHSLRATFPNDEVFCYTDPFSDDREGNAHSNFRDCQNRYLQKRYDYHGSHINQSHPPLVSSRSIEAAMIANQLQQRQQQLNYYSGDYGMHYARSEPNFHQNSRPISVGGMSDAFLKQGDDSAISLCSRGEAGFQNGSDYSYNEYGERPDGDWAPPEQLDGLTVQQVSKSLRYIGMKDRVILRFSNEQIDGSMLCTLDKKLLKEGFPELNALEVKKILDFVQGWRPKKC